MSIIYFAIMIGVLVFIHELGHYIAARWCGVHPKQFAIGVGPRVTGFVRDGTDFRIGLLPLGGYVMMAEHPDEAEEGRTSLPEASIPRRALIAVAGPVFSFLFPVVCYLGIGLGSAQMPATVLGDVSEDGPAAEAGLVAGDEIVSVGGREVTYWHELEDAIAATGGEPAEVVVLREGAEMVFEVDAVDPEGSAPPRFGVMLYQRDADGNPDPNAITYTDFPIGERLPWAFEYAITEPFSVAGRVGSALGGFATGATSTKELGGPIMIFDVAGRAGDQGWRTFLAVMAVISVNLALINMLPIPILDGGRLVLLGIEAIQRRPLSARTQQITAMVGLAMVVGLMLLAFKNDIERYWDGWMG